MQILTNKFNQQFMADYYEAPNSKFVDTKQRRTMAECTKR
jgi:hypothetical protein